jgi:flagellar motility protein MotE (MotC chaperone)
MMPGTIQIMAWGGAVLCLASGVAMAQPSTTSDSEAVIEYCLNISDKAEEARIARQEVSLKKLEAEIDRKLVALETRRTELQSWVERQRQLQSAAAASLVDIYAVMDPEVAAEQMANIDVRLASSILRQLKARQASLILNEMKPEQAAVLVKSIAAATKQETKPK